MDHSETPLYRFPFMESELYALACYYDTPRFSIYGFIDALRMLMLSNVEFIFISKKKNGIIFHSVCEPTLVRDFKEIASKECGATVMCWEGARGIIQNSIQISNDLYIMLFETKFDRVNPFAPLRKRSREHVILRSFIKWLSSRPTFPLIKSYIDKIEQETLQRDLAFSPLLFDAYPLDESAYDYHFEGIVRILDELYISTGQHAPLLKVMSGKNSSIPNIFFIVACAHSTKNKRIFEQCRYPYTMKMVIPPCQEYDLKNALLAGGVTEGEALRVIRDCQLPFDCERSVLDFPLSSGILNFSNPIMHDEKWTEQFGKFVIDVKIKRHNATRELFTRLFSQEIFMQEFVVHVGGAPYLLCCSITDQPMGRISKTNRASSFEYWIHHYGFYVVMKSWFAKKFKSKMRNNYYGSLYEAIRFAFNKVEACTDKWFDRLVNELKREFRNLERLYPFNSLDVYQKRKSIPNTTDVNNSVTLFECHVSYQGRGKKVFFIRSTMNRYFSHQIPFQLFSYSDEITEILTQAMAGKGRVILLNNHPSK